MTFTRTNSGVSNYPIFYNTNYVVYTEGKNVDDINSDTNLPDVIFYKSLLEKIFPNKTIKIKCVGNKDAALAYLKPLRGQVSTKSIIIVDRDYDGLKNSIIDDPLIIYTLGYSWENDLWTYALAKELTTDLASSNADISASLKVKYDNLTKRLKFISAMDAALQLDGESLLTKNNGSCGVNIAMHEKYPISRIELHRIIAKFKKKNSYSDPCVNSGLKQFVILDSNKLIQGHLWEHAITKLISYTYRKVTKDSMPSNKIIQTLGLVKFKSNPQKYLGSKAYNYYTNELTKKLV